MILYMSFSKWYHYKIFLERELFSVLFKFSKTNVCCIYNYKKPTIIILKRNKSIRECITPVAWYICSVNVSLF